MGARERERDRSREEALNKLSQQNLSLSFYIRLLLLAFFSDVVNGQWGIPRSPSNYTHTLTGFCPNLEKSTKNS